MKVLGLSNPATSHIIAIQAAVLDGAVVESCQTLAIFALSRAELRWSSCLSWRDFMRTRTEALNEAEEKSCWTLYPQELPICY